jgi:predicted secreted acid phosphatase
VAAEQKEQLQNDCSALAKGVSRPSKPVLAKLAADLSAALSGKSVSAKEQAQLARAVNVVVNSANLSAAQVQTYVNAAQSALKASGIAEQDAENVVADLKAIVAELQKNKPKLYQ